MLDEVEAGERSIPSFDLIADGFPRQDYSVAKPLSLAGGIEGKKGVLWRDIYRMIHLKEPKYVLLENVDRLLKSPAKQRGRDFAIILSCLNEAGYSAEWCVINAADYGMPQKRKRAYIYGEKTKRKWNLENRLAKNGVMVKAFPDSLDKPARTILTGEGKSGASKMKHVIVGDSGKHRRLVPDELDQVQMFTKGWTDTGMTDGHRAFCKGNQCYCRDGTLLIATEKHVEGH